MGLIIQSDELGTSLVELLRNYSADMRFRRLNKAEKLAAQAATKMLIPLFIFIEIIEIPAVFFLGFWFLMQMFSGAGSIAHTTGSQGGVAFWAHVAGFIAGLVGVFVFRRPERQRVEWWNER